MVWVIVINAGSAVFGGTNKPTNRHTDIATYELNHTRGLSSESLQQDWNILTNGPHAETILNRLDLSASNNRQFPSNLRCIIFDPVAQYSLCTKPTFCLGFGWPVLQRPSMIEQFRRDPVNAFDTHSRVFCWLFI